MNNNYFHYLSYNSLLKKYSDAFSLLEESEGEITPEIEIKLKEAEDNLEILGYDVLNLIDNIENEQQLNIKRIENLKKQNNSFDNQIEYLKKFLQNIIKQKGKFNENKNNTNLKLGERSITVSKKSYNEIQSSFSDKRFIKYNISKVSSEFFDRINTFLIQRGETPKIEEILLKEELNKAIKNGEKIEGVITKEKDQLYIK